MLRCDKRDRSVLILLVVKLIGRFDMRKGLFGALVDWDTNGIRDDLLQFL